MRTEVRVTGCAGGEPSGDARVAGPSGHHVQRDGRLQAGGAALPRRAEGKPLVPAPGIIIPRRTPLVQRTSEASGVPLCLWLSCRAGRPRPGPRHLPRPDHPPCRTALQCNVFRCIAHPRRQGYPAPLVALLRGGTAQRGAVRLGISSGILTP